MRIKPLIRRLFSLRITTVWTFLYRQLPLTPSSPRVHKHIKIDDEEQNIGDLSLPTHPPYKTRHRRSLAHLLRMLLLILLSLLVVALLLGYIIYKPPNFVIRMLQYRSPTVLYHVPLPASNRTLALTIDDTPSTFTPQILDLLKEHGAKATFFVIGSQVSSRPSTAIIQRIHDEGHELGNHAWSDEPSISLPLSELSRQISDVEVLLPGNANGMKYFRPGSGVFGKKMLKAVEKLGYKLILGSIYPHDPQIHNARVNAKHVLSMVRPGGIIIMHDRRDYSVEQLRLVLRGLKEGGWKVESIGGLLAVADQRNGLKPD